MFHLEISFVKSLYDILSIRVFEVAFEVLVGVLMVG